MDPFTIAAILSAITGAGAGYVNNQARKAEDQRLQEFQRQRTAELMEAQNRQRQRQFEGMQASDAIRDQMAQTRAEQQRKFGDQISQFDMVEKSKGLKDKQGERIQNQRDVITQAESDGKLRAGSDVKGRISGDFTESVADRTGQVLARADNISQLMGRLSGTKADMMREGDILQGMTTDQKVLAGREAAMRDDIARQNNINALNATRAGNTREERLFKYDPTSSTGKNLGYLSSALGLASMGGAAAGAGLFGEGAKTWVNGLPDVGTGWFGASPAKADALASYEAMDMIQPGWSGSAPRKLGPPGMFG